MIDERLSQAFEASTSPGRTPLFCFSSKTKFGRSGKLGNAYKMVVVITNTGLDIREPKSSKLRQSYSWLSVDSVKIEGENLSIFIRPNDEVLIAPENPKVVIEQISDVMQRVLLPDELENAGFWRYDFEKLQPTVLGVLSRMSMLIAANNIQVSPKSIELFQSMLTGSQPNINLNLFKDKMSFVPIAFDLIPLMQFVRTVKVPLIKKFPTYRMVADRILQMPFVKSIEIAGQADEGFGPFHNNMLNSQLENISYTYSEFTNSELDVIAQNIVSSKIHSLEFHNAVAINFIPYFYSDFLTPAINRHLWSLNLDRTINLNIHALLPNITNLCSLSLSNCGIDVKLTLSLIAQNNMKNLTYLNISGNMCNGILDIKTLRLPGSVTHLVADSVSWNEGSILSFWIIVLRSNRKNELHLSLANSIVLPHEWPSVFKVIGRSTFSHLYSLIWDENPVDSSFFNFLNRNPRLTYLSLNKCFNENMDDSISLLTDFIKENDSVQQLYLSGSKKIYFGKSIEKVISSCLRKHNLKVLDLSISKGGNQSLKFFLQLFDKDETSLDTLIIDGVFPEEAGEYIDFLKRVKELQNRKDTYTLLSFPRGDVQLMKKQNKIDQNQLDDIEKLYHLQETTKATKSFDHLYSAIQDSKLVAPMNLYQYYKDPFIPLFLNNEQVNLIYSQDFAPFTNDSPDEFDELLEETTETVTEKLSQNQSSDYPEEESYSSSKETQTTYEKTYTSYEDYSRESFKPKRRSTKKRDVSTSESSEIRLSRISMKKSTSKRKENQKSRRMDGSINSSRISNSSTRTSSSRISSIKSRSINKSKDEKDISYEENENENSNTTKTSSTLSDESSDFSSSDERKIQNRVKNSVNLARTSIAKTRTIPENYELPKNTKNLILKFAKSYNISNTIKCPEFELIQPNEAVWDTINKEESIDILFKRIKNDK